MVVRGSVNIVFAEKSIGGTHLRTGSDDPFNVEILEEEQPTSLSVREFSRILDVRQIFVISDNRDRVWGALEVLLPFREYKDDSKEFPVIDVIVLFGWGEHL